MNRSETPRSYDEGPRGRWGEKNESRSWAYRAYRLRKERS